MRDILHRASFLRSSLVLVLQQCNLSNQFLPRNTARSFFNMASFLSSSTPSPSPDTTSSTVPKGVIIFCHGSGDSGPGVQNYVEALTPPSTLLELESRGIQFRYPTAQRRPYRLMGGLKSTVWFDRYGGMDPKNPEDTPSVLNSVDQLHQLINEYIEQGVPSRKICLGGFSMGGGIALQAAARFEGSQPLGAVFCLSSYLCDDSMVWSLLEETKTNDNRNRLLSSPILMMHGESDGFVLPEWGERTRRRLADLGCAGVRPLVSIPYAGHEMTREELAQLFEFLNTVYT